jgi:hypothetical protein
MKTEEDEEFERVERESGWRKRQIMVEDDDDIQDYKKPWEGLTDEDLQCICDEWQIYNGSWMRVFVGDIEAKLKERNR